MKNSFKTTLILVVVAVAMLFATSSAGTGQTSRGTIRATWYSQFPIQGGGASESMVLLQVPNQGDSVLDKNGFHRQISRVIYVSDASIQLQVGEPKTGY